MSAAAEQPVCTYYLRNVCAYGDRCSRFHGPKQQAPPVSVSQNVCPYYLSGNCRFGSSCKNVHSVLPTSRVLHQNRQRPKQESLGTASAPFGPCKFFIRGQCGKGDQCPFLHPNIKVDQQSALADTTSVTIVSRSEVDTKDPAQLKAQKSNPQDESFECRSFYSCTVRFGDGAIPKYIQTSFETARIIIRNLPLPVARSDVFELVSPFGDVKTIVIQASPVGTVANVKFSTYLEAETAQAALHEIDYSTQELAVQLDFRSREREKASLRSTKVRATWYAPSARAWAHFPSISQAKRSAEHLDGKLFDGRKISASFQIPSRNQTESFSVILKGLSENVRQPTLLAFSQAQSVSVKRPKRSHLAQETVVHALLSEIGHVESFESLPARQSSSRVVAFAQFETPEKAEEAIKRLHREKPRDLGESPLYLEIVHAIKYSLPRNQFRALLPELERIAATQMNTAVRWYDVDQTGQPSDPVVVRAHSSAPDALGKTKHELDALIKGDILCSGGKSLWHPFLAENKLPHKLCDAIANYGFVKVDSRSRVLRFYGDQNRRWECERLLSDHIDNLAERGWSIDIPPRSMRSLMLALSDLRQRFSETVISLDVQSHALNIKGSDEQNQNVKSEVASIISAQDPWNEHRLEGVTCPVCFCPIDEDSQQLGCGHSYCSGCLQFFLESAAGGDFDQVRCVYEGDNTEACGSLISLSVIRSKLPPEKEEKLLEAAFLSYVNSHPEEFRFCPSPDCQVVYRKGSSGVVLTCSSCLTRICPSCCVGFHEGLTCAEHKDQASGGYQALQKWREENGVKSCPKCGVDIQKADGCNHMKCTRCGTHMCWVCLMTFGTRSGEVYDHMNKVHRNIF